MKNTDSVSRENVMQHMNACAKRILKMNRKISRDQANIDLEIENLEALIQIAEGKYKEAH